MSDRDPTATRPTDPRKATHRPTDRRRRTVDVEVFPTDASIEMGHRLRIAVQSFDTARLSPTIPQLPSRLAPMVIHNSKRYPSTLTIAAVR